MILGILQVGVICPDCVVCRCFAVYDNETTLARSSGCHERDSHEEC
jgi:hypothetical protein